MIIENDGLHQQLKDVVEDSESNVRLEKQVDGSIAVTDYTSHQVLIEVKPKMTEEQDEMKKVEVNFSYTAQLQAEDDVNEFVDNVVDGVKSGDLNLDYEDHEVTEK